jgi:hypothetical protein
MRIILEKVSPFSLFILILVMIFVVFEVVWNLPVYVGKLLPKVTDPCDPNAPPVIRDSQDSRWPIRRSREDRCPSGKTRN